MDNISFINSLVSISENIYIYYIILFIYFYILFTVTACNSLVKKSHGDREGDIEV